jgi:hypothetical protein
MKTNTSHLRDDTLNITLFFHAETVTTGGVGGGG